MLAKLRSEESPQEVRRGVRRELWLAASSSSLGTDVLVRNISPTGLLIQVAADLQDGDEIRVILPDQEPRAARVVWGKDEFYGCEFLEPISIAAVSASALKSAPQVTSPIRSGALDVGRERAPAMAPGASALLAATCALAIVIVVTALLLV